MVRRAVDPALQVSSGSRTPLPGFASNPATLGGHDQGDLVGSDQQAQVQVTATTVVPEPQFCSTGPPTSRDAVVAGPLPEFVLPAQTGKDQRAPMEHRLEEAMSGSKLLGQVPQPLPHDDTGLQAQTSDEPREVEKPDQASTGSQVPQPRNMPMTAGLCNLKAHLNWPAQPWFCLGRKVLGCHQGGPRA